MEDGKRRPRGQLREGGSNLGLSFTGHEQRGKEREGRHETQSEREEEVNFEVNSTPPHCTVLVCTKWGSLVLRRIDRGRSNGARGDDEIIIFA